MDVTTPDPEFDPTKPVKVNGYDYVPSSVLRAHHQWHLARTDPDEYPSSPEAYRGSKLCDLTVAALNGD